MSARKFAIAVATAALMLTGAGNAFAADRPSDPVGTAGSTKHCPVAEMVRVWDGATQNPATYEQCGDLADWYGHLFYSGTMLSTWYQHQFRMDTVVVQLRLRDLSYAPLAVDGYYGPQTAGAVTRYQKNHGLIVDGKVGRQTWKALFGLS